MLLHSAKFDLVPMSLGGEIRGLLLFHRTLGRSRRFMLYRMYCIEPCVYPVSFCLPLRPMSQRLEDRIKQLCAKALSTPESPALNEVLKQLQNALHEHTNRLRNMVASRRTRTERGSVAFDVVDLCAICGTPIQLEQARVSTEGKPVHEKCFLDQVNARQRDP
jgi:hypothetical protein